MPVLVDHGATLDAAQYSNVIAVQTGSGRPQSDRPERLRLAECRIPGSVFAELVSDTALRMDVEPRALSVRALLHLPRVATSSGWVTRTQIARELSHSARRLHGDARAVQDLVPVRNFALQELIFAPIASATAEAWS